MSVASYVKDVYAELGRLYWPSFGTSVRRMISIVIVFLLIGGFALLIRYVAIWVRDLVASAT